MELPGIQYKGNVSKELLTENDYYGELRYFYDYESFDSDTAYSKFVREVERLVRTHPDYKHFIDYIKHTVGLDFCQVFSQIYDKVDAEIEFHHGPIFTLYDICEIELNKFLKCGDRVNVFRVADSVLDLHFMMKIGGVMLSKTAHEMAHNQDLFINVSQAIGDINGYIQMRSPYFTQETRYKLWTYLHMCKDNPSFDKGALDYDIVKTYVKPLTGEE